MSVGLGIGSLSKSITFAAAPSVPTRFVRNQGLRTITITIITITITIIITIIIIITIMFIITIITNKTDASRIRGWAVAMGLEPKNDEDALAHVRTCKDIADL